VRPNKLFGYPDLSFIDNMRDAPTPAMEFPRDPAAVTFPGESFGAYYCYCACGGDFFQLVYTTPELVCLSISVITALTQTAQFTAQKGVFQAFSAQQACKILLSEGGYLASGKTANISDYIDSVKKNYLDEILFTPIGGSEGVNSFRGWFHAHSISQDEAFCRRA